MGFFFFFFLLSTCLNSWCAHVSICVWLDICRLKRHVLHIPTCPALTALKSSMGKLSFYDVRPGKCTGYSLKHEARCLYELLIHKTLMLMRLCSEIQSHSTFFSRRIRLDIHVGRWKCYKKKKGWSFPNNIWQSAEACCSKNWEDCDFHPGPQQQPLNLCFDSNYYTSTPLRHIIDVSEKFH